MKFWAIVTASAALGVCFFAFSIIPSDADVAGTPTDQTFQATKLNVDGVSGRLTIETAPAGSPIRVRASGMSETLRQLLVQQQGDTVLVQLPGMDNQYWWPWSLLNWKSEKYDDLTVVVSMPKGLPVTISEFSGYAQAGDLDAPLQFGAAGGGKANFGRVTDARLSVSGSLDVQTGDVMGFLNIEVAGSGEIRTGSARDTRIEIAGSGEAYVGAVTGRLSVAMAGSGETRVASATGPVDIQIAGSGDVIIDGGRADPFGVSIAGSGNVVFRGEAVNPRIEILGSGDVSVASYSGQLSQSIMGSGDFRSGSVAPSPPAPPAPPAPPSASMPLPSVPPVPPAPGRGGTYQSNCPQPSDICVHRIDGSNNRQVRSDNVQVVQPWYWPK